MWEKLLNQFFDRYGREARLYPTVLALLPAYLIMLTVFTSYDEAAAYVKLTFGLFLTFVFIYFGTDITRNVGKLLEMKIFGDEFYFPTTSLLLHSNTRFSQEKRQQLCNKICNEFNITFLTQEEETLNELEARKRVKEVTGLMRQKLGNGRLLLQYNIRYGFWRNLIASTPFSITLCFISAIVSTLVPNQIIFFSSLCLVPIYLLLWIYRRAILNYFAYQYADQFYLEYNVR